MPDILSIALVAMHQDMARLDRTASNLANVSTTAYKRDAVAARPFVEAVDAALNDAAAAGGIASTFAGAAPTAVRIDSRPGTLKSTSRPLDVAITGDGYFEVATADGPAYTRQGDLRLDGRGRLVTADGLPLMGRGGDIYLTSQSPVIGAAGDITEAADAEGARRGAADGPAAWLKVVRFDAGSVTQRIGGGLMAAGTGMTVVDTTEAGVRQGALENANVVPMHEMTQMLQTMRHFESMQKVAQGFDDMLSLAIRKLGDVA